MIINLSYIFFNSYTYIMIENIWVFILYKYKILIDLSSRTNWS